MSSGLLKFVKSLLNSGVPECMSVVSVIFMENTVVLTFQFASFE
jgi:hypothetical protein